MERYESPPALLTTREVAALLRVHPKTVDRWRQAGKIRGRLTPGGHWRYPVAQLADLGGAALGDNAGRHAR